MNEIKAWIVEYEFLARSNDSDIVDVRVELGEPHEYLVPGYYTWKKNGRLFTLENKAREWALHQSRNRTCRNIVVLPLVTKIYE